MAIQIISEEYGPRKPLINCTADSVEELAGLVCAEGSTATVGGTKYTLDRTQGWVEPGSGGGGGTGGGAFMVTFTVTPGAQYVVECDKTFEEVKAAYDSGAFIYGRELGGYPEMPEYGLNFEGFVISAFGFGRITIAGGGGEIATITREGYMLTNDDTVVRQHYSKRF